MIRLNRLLCAFIVSSLALTAMLPPPSLEPKYKRSGTSFGTCWATVGGPSYGYSYCGDTDETIYWENQIIVSKEYWFKKYTREKTTIETICMVYKLHMARFKRLFAFGW